MDTYKTCTMCGKALPATTEYFYRIKAGEEALRSTCKTCSNEYNRKYKRKYNEVHREQLKPYREAYNKDYNKSIKGMIANFNSHSRTRFQDNYISDISVEQFQLMLICFDFKCAYTGVPLNSENFSFDHVQTRTKQGIHHISNIVPCCKEANNRKHAKDFLEWYPTTEYYDKDRLNHILAWQRFALSIWSY